MTTAVLPGCPHSPVKPMTCQSVLLVAPPSPNCSVVPPMVSVKYWPIVVTPKPFRNAHVTVNSTWPLVPVGRQVTWP